MPGATLLQGSADSWDTSVNVRGGNRSLKRWEITDLGLLQGAPGDNDDDGDDGDDDDDDDDDDDNDDDALTFAANFREI